MLRFPWLPLMFYDTPPVACSSLPLDGWVGGIFCFVCQNLAVFGTCNPYVLVKLKSSLDSLTTAVKVQCGVVWCGVVWCLFEFVSPCVMLSVVSRLHALWGVSVHLSQVPCHIMVSLKNLDLIDLTPAADVMLLSWS